MSKIIICTKAEAIIEINKRRGLKHVGYGAFVRPFLPTSEDRGFEGCGIIKTTKNGFLELLDSLLDQLDKRGAKVELTVPTEDYESFYV